jgi:hypothetical protein
MSGEPLWSRLPSRWKALVGGAASVVPVLASLAALPVHVRPFVLIVLGATLLQVGLLVGAFLWGQQSGPAILTRRKTMAGSLLVVALLVFGNVVAFSQGHAPSDTAARVFLGQWLSFSGFLFALSRFYAVRQPAVRQSGWPTLQVLARLLLSAGLLGLGGGIIGLAIQLAPTGFHLGGMVAFFSHRVGQPSRHFLNWLGRSEESDSLAVEGIAVGWIGVALISSRGRFLSYLSLGVGILLGFNGGSVIVDHQVQLGVAVLAMGVSLCPVGFFLERGMRRPLITALVVVGFGGNLALIGCLHAHTYGLMVSYGVIAVACLLWALSLIESDDVLSVDEVAPISVRTHWPWVTVARRTLIVTFGAAAIWVTFFIAQRLQQLGAHAGLRLVCLGIAFAILAVLAAWLSVSVSTRVKRALKNRGRQ